MLADPYEFFRERYRLRRRWGFWQVQEWGPARDWGWYSVRSYIRKDGAIAHCVRLKLEGKEVEF